MDHTLSKDAQREATPCTVDGSPWGLLPEGRRKRRCGGKPKFSPFILKGGGRNTGGRGREHVSQPLLFGLQSQRTEIYQGEVEDISRKKWHSAQLVASNIGMKMPTEGPLSQPKSDDDWWLIKRGKSCVNSPKLPLVLWRTPGDPQSPWESDTPRSVPALTLKRPKGQVQKESVYAKKINIDL